MKMLLYTLVRGRGGFDHAGCLPLPGLPEIHCERTPSARGAIDPRGVEGNVVR